MIDATVAFGRCDKRRHDLAEVVGVRGRLVDTDNPVLARLEIRCPVLLRKKLWHKMRSKRLGRTDGNRRSNHNVLRATLLEITNDTFHNLGMTRAVDLGHGRGDAYKDDVAVVHVLHTDVVWVPQMGLEIVDADFGGRTRKPGRGFADESSPHNAYT